MRDYQEILKALPYSDPFLFVDEILHMDENGCEGTYLFRDDLPFYRGHFKDEPVTPGVILTECCAQIGLVCLGIFILEKSEKRTFENTAIALTSSEMEFYIPVFPGERVRVKSEKLYYRFSKLKCKITMFNEQNEVVCKGQIAGMIKARSDA
ncbi:3-hydroxyacyl-ACP dehydratase FabZ family protein [Muriicola marianensis]|uniref:Beta-hydroxyacyl-ACP dehydratase n=1 Tax=Muriicola marianensis TaxID=1324801 RepID=A0ABQ1QR51_9FLAO|nr:3-hydroxyacyl-ACP dehydratase FabZ family protein [Muriicola marianensis]GGD39324.1 beta-hydroxyacyl-ACP dehydratase [Muriicola marianensis]